GALVSARLVEGGSEAAELGLAALAVGTGRDDLLIQIVEPIALSEPLGGGAGCVGGGNDAVPTPDVALAGDEKLARAQLGLQPAALRLADDADLLEAPHQQVAAGDEAGKRGGADRERWIVVVDEGAGPVHG